MADGIRKVTDYIWEVDEGVVSPGGVGYDINCGVRLMASKLRREDVAPHMAGLMRALFHAVPSGVGSEGAIRLSQPDLRAVAAKGAPWAEARGMGTNGDIEHMEEGGCMPGANPDAVSDRAWKRGLPQLGTLGAGNHFLEVGYVSEIYDEAVARIFGLSLGQFTVSIHSGSRGFGHQICDDYLASLDKAVRKYGIELPDRQLACAPVQSPEGQAYLGAMRCAVNYAFANRQAMAHNAREAFQRALRLKPEEVGLRTVYEIAHNIAKIETHLVDGRERKVCVHRKGATRAFGPGHPEIPSAYRAVGQPVLVPGDMGRCSYVLVGTEGAMRDTFGSTCHGAGRTMSRHKARSAARGRDIIRELGDRSIVVMAESRGTLDEEISEAYKDVTEVVDVCAGAGISRKVAQLRPLGCMKG
jgi:tRNA-splicing ligase RtcB